MAKAGGKSTRSSLEPKLHSIEAAFAGAGAVPKTETEKYRKVGELMPAAKWFAMEVANLKTETDCPQHITDAARVLAKRMADAHAHCACDKKWTVDSIKNKLHNKFGWPSAR